MLQVGSTTYLQDGPQVGGTVYLIRVRLAVPTAEAEHVLDTKLSFRELTPVFGNLGPGTAVTICLQIVQLTLLGKLFEEVNSTHIAR